MCLRVVVYLLTLWFFVVQISEAADDPNEWPSKYPGCAGRKQSPIALNSKEVSVTLCTGHPRNHVVDREICLPKDTVRHAKGCLNLFWNQMKRVTIGFKGQFLNRDARRLFAPWTRFINYNQGFDGQATNDGHTITISVNPPNLVSTPVIFGGPLIQVYEAVSFHFHWGSPDSKGSEHEIDGKKYDMELHIIHKNILFDTLDSALGVPGGVTVVGILLEQTPADANTKGLDAVCDLLPSLVNFGSTVPVPAGFTLLSLVNTTQLTSFYTYNGSLTTPPCTENITWIVSTAIQKVSTDCLNKFFMILDESNQPLVNNFRPLQPLNDRKVYLREELS